MIVFSQGNNTLGVIVDMVLDASFDGGKVVQSAYTHVRRGDFPEKLLVYREGRSGKWLRSDGISFNGDDKTPENLVRSIGGADPIEEIYVMAAN